MSNLTIYKRDPSDKDLRKMSNYCRDNQLRLTKFEHIDVSDISYDCDMIACFTFSDSEDAMLFKLRFK